MMLSWHSCDTESYGKLCPRVEKNSNHLICGLQGCQYRGWGTGKGRRKMSSGAEAALGEVMKKKLFSYNLHITLSSSSPSQ